jgi:hypothetical protein
VSAPCSWTGAAALALALLAPVGVRAQVDPGAAPDRAQLEQRVRQRFAETVKAELGITQEQLDRLGKVQESFQERRRDLARRDVALRRRMAPDAARPSDDDAKQILKELVSVRDDEAKLFRSEMDGVLEVLTPVQAVRFYVLRDQLMQRVRRLRQNGPGRGGPGGPPLGRGPGLR